MKRNLKSGVKKRRQVSALERLEEQLQSGTKSVKCVEATDGGSTWFENVPLSEKDIKRIKQEIQTLKSRI